MWLEVGRFGIQDSLIPNHFVICAKFAAHKSYRSILFNTVSRTILSICSSDERDEADHGKKKHKKRPKRSGAVVEIVCKGNEEVSVLNHLGLKESVSPGEEKTMHLKKKNIYVSNIDFPQNANEISVSYQSYGPLPLQVCPRFNPQ